MMNLFICCVDVQILGIKVRTEKQMHVKYCSVIRKLLIKVILVDRITKRNTTACVPPCDMEENSTQRVIIFSSEEVAALRVTRRVEKSSISNNDSWSEKIQLN